MVLFPKALFFVTNFPKSKLNSNRNSNFLNNFHQKLSKFSQHFTTLCVRSFLKKTFENLRRFSLNIKNRVFLQSREKYTQSLLNFLNLLKIMHFRNFIKKTFETYENYFKISQHFVFFVQTRKSLTHSFLKLLENMLALCIFPNLLKRFFEIFKICVSLK